MSAVVAFLVLCLVSWNEVQAAQCTPDPTNPCMARCNGTLFDISNLFDYPVKVSDARSYTYMWSPCTSYKECHLNDSRNDEDCAVCQHADAYYNCGHSSNPIYLFNYHFDSVVFQIQYLWGVDWRMTVFTFLEDPSQEDTTIAFTGEDPYLQYNFLVRGKCIGRQYAPGCKTGK